LTAGRPAAWPRPPRPPPAPPSRPARPLRGRPPPRRRRRRRALHAPRCARPSRSGRPPRPPPRAPARQPRSSAVRVPSRSRLMLRASIRVALCISMRVGHTGVRTATFGVCRLAAGRGRGQTAAARHPRNVMGLPTPGPLDPDTAWASRCAPLHSCLGAGVWRSRCAAHLDARALQGALRGARGARRHDLCWRCGGGRLRRRARRIRRARGPRAARGRCRLGLHLHDAARLGFRHRLNLP